MGCEPVEGLPLLGGALLADLALTSAPSLGISESDAGSSSPSGSRQCGGGRYSRRGGRSRGGGSGWEGNVVVRREGVGGEGGRPAHHSRSVPHAELGDAVLERRLLELAGRHVVSVPRHLWRVWEGPEEQLMFLHARLAEAEWGQGAGKKR